MITQSEYSGGVFLTNSVALLGLVSATSQAFSFHNGDLFHVRYASASDFSAGLVEVTHLAHLSGIASLGLDDFSFV